MEMASLRREMRQSRKAAFADGISRNLITQWKAYFMFCIYFNFPILPSSTNGMCSSSLDLWQPLILFKIMLAALAPYTLDWDFLFLPAPWSAFY